MVDDKAFTLMSNLNTLAVCGFDVGMVYLLGIDMVMSIYESLTAAGKGGAIADTIVNYENQAELEEWCVNAIPGALGPLLRTLISPPDDFSVTRTGPTEEAAKSEQKYGKSEAHLLQQQAIERILGWIVKNAKKQGTIEKAQQQFEYICMCMNRFGVKPEDGGQVYCENRLALDNFMAESVLSLFNDQSDTIRSAYKKHVSILGANLDSSCQRSQYYGRTYIPTGTVKYINPVL
jgi:hypothetical protein